jgi:hypothetical protein
MIERHQMKTLQQIVRNGIQKDVSDFSYIAAISLRIALMSFYRTYSSVSNSYFALDKAGKWLDNDDDYSYHYYRDYFETIVHFQHFVEIVCKDLLRKDHPLLTVDASNYPLVLYKLIHSEYVSPEELEGIRSVEFREALNRAVELGKNGIGNSSLALFVKWREPLNQLNVLRNRLWHRGTFFLRYPALDLFIGQYILPFVMDVMEFDWYKQNKVLWHHSAILCNIDLLREIRDETAKGEKYNRAKVAILKALGCAAYDNPLLDENLYGEIEGTAIQAINDLPRARAEKTALAELTNELVNKVLVCPVCGVNSLLVDDYWVRCINCNLYVTKWLGNPSFYGLPIADSWFDD